MKNYDYDKLRADLIDYYRFIATAGYKIAYLDVYKIEKATEEELEAIAIRNNYNLENYIIEDKKTR